MRKNMESTKNIETEEKQQKCKEDSLLLRSLKTSLVAIVHANLVILLFNSIDLIWIDFIDPVVFMIAAILLVMALPSLRFFFQTKKYLRHRISKTCRLFTLLKYASPTSFTRLFAGIYKGQLRPARILGHIFLN